MTTFFTIEKLDRCSSPTVKEGLAPRGGALLNSRATAPPLRRESEERFTELKKLLLFGALGGGHHRTVPDGIGLRKVAYPSVA